MDARIADTDELLKAATEQLHAAQAERARVADLLREAHLESLRLNDGRQALQEEIAALRHGLEVEAAALHEVVARACTALHAFLERAGDAGWTSGPAVDDRS